MQDKNLVLNWFKSSTDHFWHEGKMTLKPGPIFGCKMQYYGLKRCNLHSFEIKICRMQGTTKDPEARFYGIRWQNQAAWKGGHDFKFSVKGLVEQTGSLLNKD